MKKILLITTGGTITAVQGEMGFTHTGEEKGDSLAQIMSGLGEVETLNLYDIDSSNCLPEHWNKLAEAIKQNSTKYDAIIITHGTDTLAYSVAAISFACGDLKIPVCVTGAQIPYSQIGSDAPTNLVNTMKTLNDNKIKGIYGVFGSSILAAGRVKKNSEFDYFAFRSFGSKVLGEIGTFIKYNEQEIEEYNSFFGNREYINKFDSEHLEVFNLFPGWNSKRLISNVENGFTKAVVIRSYADGNTNIADLRDMYKYLRDKEIPVAHISQPDKGTTTMSIYDVGVEAKSLGAVPTFDMTTECLTAKMSWLLGQNLNYEEFKKALQTNYIGEITIN